MGDWTERIIKMEQQAEKLGEFLIKKIKEK